MAVGVLARAAARARVPVFPVVGAGAARAVQDLRLRPEVELVSTPRHATVLLVAGRVPRSLSRPLAQVHDQVPHPRATVRWTGSPPGPDDVVSPATTGVGADGDVVATIVSCHRGLLSGGRASEDGMLPAEPPNPWRGVGPHGQGGEGMMGGTPYGRPMPMTADDRDGLMLDQLSVRVGPFLPVLPPGLALDVRLQGDVVQRAGPVNVFRDDDEAPAGGRLDPAGVFERASSEPVAVVDVEVARARHHLRWLAHALVVHGLPALAVRTLRLAFSAGPGQVRAVARLRRALARAGVLGWAGAGVGRIEPDQLAGQCLGPVARATGIRVDARRDDPSYAGLGFEPITHSGGDARGRLRQRLAEAEQALQLAARASAEGRLTEPGRVEGPRGVHVGGRTPTGVLVDLLPGLLEGLEWGQAVTAVTSLDLDMQEAAPTPAEVR
ncbi:hypothetical protein BH20ACT9_BH20ACT9_03470 [soil metagenome]